MSDDAALELQTRMWTIGDYPVIARHLLPISEAVVDALDIQPGEQVLDVATGNGNAAILAARRGAQVLAVDLTPAQIERARARCQAEGVRIDLRIRDAEALQVPDASYDVVMSVMGVIFAPHPDVASNELARVCRPGGRVAITSWAASGWGVAWRRKAQELAPGAPTGPTPDEWGDPAVAAARLGATGMDVTVEERDFHWRFPSIDDAFDTFATAAGPFVLFVAGMEEQGRGEEVRAALQDVMREVNVATDGSVDLPAAYLLITAMR